LKHLDSKNCNLFRILCLALRISSSEGQGWTGHLVELTSRFFAEFLEPPSLARLSLLDQPTCVGLRYGNKTFLPRLDSRQGGLPANLFLETENHQISFENLRIFIASRLKRFDGFSNQNYLKA